MSSSDSVGQFLSEVKSLCDSVSQEEIGRAIEALFRAWKDEKTIFIIGNGGSASTATHFAADLVQCTLSPHKRRVKAVSLFDNVPLTSALVNDRGWEDVYLEQLRTFARPGDVCIGISV
ncbi:MAG: SIS domain-containing protein, partial [Patescibacteria group bacterium]